MAEEFTTTKLNADNHLILEQSLLRLPLELMKRNLKLAQVHISQERKHVLAAIAEASNAAAKGQDPQQSLAALDGMISRMQGLKRKMEQLHEEEKMLQHQSAKRIQHLSELYNIPSLVDVKYDEWSRVSLNRLLVDYLLRTGYSESAKALALDKGIEDLVDIAVFVKCHRIEQSLRNGVTAEALTWLSENKHSLKTAASNLEFELRLQQYIELRRENELLKAKAHAEKYLSPHIATYPTEVNQAAALLAFPRNTLAEPYKTMYSQERWNKLAELFVKTHHGLLGLPTQPLLHIALSAGLSALKTPSCHSEFTSSSSNASSTTTSVCPICSEELKELARTVPYAHHSKSFVESDPVVLPNGRIYGRERLMQIAAKLGLEKGKVKDTVTGEIFDEDLVRKVYIS